MIPGNGTALSGSGNIPLFLPDILRWLFRPQVLSLMLIPIKKWVPVTAYTLAGLAGLSRVYDNKHWISDVFAGAVLGYFVGELVYQNDFENMPEEMLLPAGKASWRHPEQVMMALSVTAVLMHTDLLQIKPLHTTISPVGFRVEIPVR